MQPSSVEQVCSQVRELTGPLDPALALPRDHSIYSPATRTNNHQHVHAAVLGGCDCATLCGRIDRSVPGQGGWTQLPVTIVILLIVTRQVRHLIDRHKAGATARQ